MTRFTIAASARKDIRKLSGPDRRRLEQKLRYWERSAQPLQFAVPLQQHQQATHRFRIGAYRVIVKQIARRELRILRVRHRKDVYRF